MSWVPSIQVLTEKRLALHNEPGIPYSFWMVYVDLVAPCVLDLCTKLGWKALMSNNKNPYFFVTTKTDGVFAQMQIISSSFIILKHIQIDLQFWKLLMLKVRLYFFLVGGGGQTVEAIFPPTPVPAWGSTFFFSRKCDYRWFVLYIIKKCLKNRSLFYHGIHTS